MEKTEKNVFITGRAGTGKSTLLTYFRSKTKKKVVVLAPTGVAALNVEGQTIHSFFRFRPDITPKSVTRIRRRGNKKTIYEKLDAIIIDEISMVRADLLDCVDQFMRQNGRNSHKPFGGVQMIFIGDLYQLPPVVTSREKEIFRGHYDSPYFFSAHVFTNFPMEFMELEKIYRQHDNTFIEILNAIRNNAAKDPHLEMLNRRLDPNFSPPRNTFFIYLTPTNDLADKRNREELLKIHSKIKTYEGIINGEFKEKDLPTEKTLHIKVGAQVMLLNNDKYDRWVNGSVGRIEGLYRDPENDFDIIEVKLSEGVTVQVTPFQWEIFHYFYNEGTGSVDSEVVGTFTQYPMRLAWAVTIHKSQGKTFDRVILDIGRGTFAHGQLYVALSRCTSLSGLVLAKPILQRHIWMDWRVVKFVTRYQYHLSEVALPIDEKMEIIREAIKNKHPLHITYLKPNDEKSRRIIRPKKIGEMEYEGKPFLGLRAFCEKRQDERVFRVDRILELSTQGHTRG